MPMLPWAGLRGGGMLPLPLLAGMNAWGGACMGGYPPDPCMYCSCWGVMYMAGLPCMPCIPGTMFTIMLGVMLPVPLLKAAACAAPYCWSIANGSPMGPYPA